MKLKISEEKLLSTAKLFLLNLVFLNFFISCASNVAQSTVVEDSCKETRGAIDIGSGTTKLIVAEVDKCELKIVNIIFEAQRAIALKEDLTRNKNKFSDETIKKLISNLNELDYLARSQGATKIAALATSAFRTATDAQKSIAKIEKSIEFKINVISQEDEAMHAYLAAIVSTKKLKLDESKPRAVWDIGGGSMQIIKEIPQKKPVIYMGQTASVSFKNKVISLKGKSAKSPNPLGKNVAIEAMNLSRKLAKSEALKILKSLENYEVIGVGGVHYFSVRNQIEKNKHEYTQEEVLNTLLERAKLTDKEIGGQYAETDVTNLALVLGFMQSLKVEKVHTLNINMANGLLLDQKLWQE